MLKVTRSPFIVYEVCNEAQAYVGITTLSTKEAVRNLLWPHSRYYPYISRTKIAKQLCVDCTSVTCKTFKIADFMKEHVTEIGQFAEVVDAKAAATKRVAELTHLNYTVHSMSPGVLLGSQHYTTTQSLFELQNEVNNLSMKGWADMTIKHMIYEKIRNSNSSRSLFGIKLEQV